MPGSSFRNLQATRIGTFGRQIDPIASQPLRLPRLDVAGAASVAAHRPLFLRPDLLRVRYMHALRTASSSRTPPSACPV